MKLQLPNSVSSVQDLSTLILEIKDFAKWFAHNAVKERVHAKKVSPPPTLSPDALELVRTVGRRDLLTSTQLEELISALETVKTAAPTVTITLAAPATKDVKQKLVAACREHIASDALVTFKFNASLLGGMVISYGSRVFDWSFRRQLLANRGRFMEVLRSV